MKRRQWFPFCCVLMLVAVFGGAKFYDNWQKQQVMEREQITQRQLDKTMASMRESFQFPMPSSGVIQDYGEFGQVPQFANSYHSAIDYYALPGDPVYAVAGGNVYFVGEQEAYGGLIIIDHPQNGLYSLYGHVSKRRWLIDQPTVKKGQLIGYIADVDEGYGIGTVPHLHFTMRIGSPDDYPALGQGNWMAGYTDKHPVFYDFIDPAKFISQSKQRVSD
ncbi:M23 family metallopeptidase [Vibrio intestinalis]|uniref:M23 family metallopeptidase n=1 Tax=Vibrio intestinalis TaxID=2933291 RepID=UPI0021A3D7DE|nr:M23 family metallopeptidase [Vibrio intestinalis]